MLLGTVWMGLRRDAIAPEDRGSIKAGSVVACGVVFGSLPIL